VPEMRVIDMASMRPGPWQAVPVGAPHTSVEPQHDERQMLVLRVDGVCIPRAHWGEPIEDGERIEWLLDMPADRETFRTTLQVAAIAAAIIPGLQFAAPYLAAASFAYNILLPPREPDRGAPPSDIFSAAVTGNVARLDEPIWKTYGIDKITPPFAGMPYTEYLDTDGDDVDNDQYFFAVYAIGAGPYDVLASFLGKTPVSHYQDVLRSVYLPPGTQPLVAKAGVWVSQDIGNFELDTAKSPGSYPACPPKQTVGFIGVDITADQGLGRIDSDGDAHAITVQWQVQIRNIDDAGAPIGRFRSIASETRSLNTNTPQRWSGKYLISPPARVEVRVLRTNPKFDNNATTRDAIQWVALRGYSAAPAPLNPNVAHFEIVLRASQNLSQINQTSLSLIVQGKVRTWNPNDGWSCASGDWDSYATDDARSPAWAVADALSDSVYGEALPDDRIDLLALYQLDQVWRTRQDRCDYTFTSTSDSWSAVQLLARTGRARMFRRYGVRAFKRDEIEDLPVTMFTPRMCIAGTKMQVDEKLPDTQTAYDGVIAQFRNNSKWDSDFVECPCPGVTEITKPVYRQYPGVQGRTHALREGLYDAADMALRQRTVSLTTEMQAELASFFDAVLWQPQIAQYGQSGDCVSWDEATRSLETSEPIDFSRTPVTIVLRRDDGSLTQALTVTPGSDAYHVVLPTVPDFELICDDGTRERPQFIVTSLGAAEIVKISSIEDGGRGNNGAPYWKVTAVCDDDRVHTADNPYLPGPGDLQDPIGLPGDTPTGGPGEEIIYLAAAAIEDGGTVSGGGNAVGVETFNDGHMRLFAEVYGTADLPSQWIASNPVDVSIAALYEGFMHITVANGIDPSPFLVGDAVDTWVNLGTDRSWHIVAGTALDRNPVYFALQIRPVGDPAVQASATYTGTINATNLISG
jgi:hypothetical protein